VTYYITTIGTPVTTSRQWSTALVPRTSGGWTFVTQSYLYPTGNESEWIVAHLDDSEVDVYITTGAGGIYSNTNFQVASAGTSTTTTNQLRVAGGRVFFPLSKGHIGTDLTSERHLNVAYYDPSSEVVSYLPSIAAPLSGEAPDIPQDAESLLYLPEDSVQTAAMFTDLPDPDATWLFQEVAGNPVDVVNNYATSWGASTPLRGQAATGFTRTGVKLTIASDRLTTTSPASLVDNSAMLVQMVTIGTNPASGYRCLAGFGDAVYNEVQLINGTTGAKFRLISGATETSNATDGTVEYPAGTEVVVCSKYDVTSDQLVCVIYDIDATTHETITCSGFVQTTTGGHQTISMLGDSVASTDSVLVYAAAVYGGDAELTSVQMRAYIEQYVDGPGADGVPTYHAVFYSGTTNPAGTKLYLGSQANADSSPFIAEIDTSTLAVTVHPVVGTANSQPRYAYYLAVDGNDCYIAVGQLGWELVHLNLTTDVATTLHTTSGPGFQFIQFDAQANGWRVVIYDNGVGTYYWLADGAITAYPGSGAPPGGARDVYPYHVDEGALSSPPQIDWSRGIGQVLWRPNGSSGDWTTLEYDVAIKEPVPIESLVALSDNEAFGNVEQYNGFFRYSRGELEWFGQWPGGVSQPAMLKVGSYVYFSGYPNGVLFRYDPSLDWAPDGTASGNPAYLGAFSASEMKYAYDIDYSSTRVYVSGRRERDGEGSGIGSYLIAGGTFAGTAADPLDNYNPSGLVVLEASNRVVFSGNTLDSSTAKLLVYDLALAAVAEQTVVIGWTDTGRLHKTSDDAIIVGVTTDTAYRFNVLTGTLLATQALGGDTVGTYQDPATLTIYTTIDLTLATIDPETLAVTVLGVAPVSEHFAKYTRGVLLTDEDALLLAVLEGINVATTPEAIRDRALTVIEGLTPASDSGVKFRRYRNEGGADFQDWAESHPSGAQRRVQVRTSGASHVPEVSNTDMEEHRLTMTVLVAYPHTHRWGSANGLDRDDVMDQDAFQIDEAIGMLGRANFSSPYPDACWLEGGVTERVRGTSCDFIELQLVYLYQRSR
jgi:hypothetical protein